MRIMLIKTIKNKHVEVLQNCNAFLIENVL